MGIPWWVAKCISGLTGAALITLGTTPSLVSGSSALWMTWYGGSLVFATTTSVITEYGQLILGARLPYREFFRLYLVTGAFFFAYCLTVTHHSGQIDLFLFLVLVLVISLWQLYEGRSRTTRLKVPPYAWYTIPPASMTVVFWSSTTAANTHGSLRTAGVILTVVCAVINLYAVSWIWWLEHRHPVAPTGP